MVNFLNADGNGNSESLSVVSCKINGEAYAHDALKYMQVGHTSVTHLRDDALENGRVTDVQLPLQYSCSICRSRYVYADGKLFFDIDADATH